MLYLDDIAGVDKKLQMSVDDVAGVAGLIDAAPDRPTSGIGEAVAHDAECERGHFLAGVAHEIPRYGHYGVAPFESGLGAPDLLQYGFRDACHT